MTVCVKQFEIEEDLLIDFDSAANLNHKSVDMVITDFMRDYVVKNNEEQKQLRQEAIEYANASVELEGFQLSAKDHELGKLYIDGKIDSNGLISEHEPSER